MFQIDKKKEREKCHKPCCYCFILVSVRYLLTKNASVKFAEIGYKAIEVDEREQLELLSTRTIHGNSVYWHSFFSIVFREKKKTEEHFGS